MKKLCNYFLLSFCAIVLSIAALLCINTNPTAASNAEIKDSYSIFDLPTLATISQDGKIFASKDDFTTAVFDDGVEYPAIYTNKTLTISITHKFSVIDYYSINLSTYVNGDKETLKLGATGEGVLDEYYSTYIKNGEEIPYYTFNTNQAPNIARLVQISFTVENKLYKLDFILVQTNNNFAIDDDLHWSYKYNGISETVKAPTIGATYSPITLSVPNGTKLNPTYVKFTFLGNEFVVYNIEGTFYNSFNNAALEMENILFDQSGTYEVEIYDKTKLCYDTNNYFSYNFLVKNTQTKNDSFYIHAHNEDGTLVANNQISNADVILDFVNLNDIKNNVDCIIITKSWRPSGGENISEQTEYSGNIPASLVIDEDGTYNVRVVGKNGGNIIKEYDFILIKSIRTYFKMGSDTYEIGEEEPANTYKKLNIDTKITSSYKEIYGETNYSFEVTIAKSAPEISGIAHNGRKQGEVTLTVYGVGKIKVEITQDGNTTIHEVANGERLEKLTTSGKYHVKVTDEMGTTVTKSFTITVKMNSAAKAIIIVGAILVIAFIALIIVTRSKIKVR